MPAFVHATDIRVPQDVRPFLGKPEIHWKAGRSAQELAYAWINAGGLPDAVRQVVDQSPDFAGARFIEGQFEKETDLGTPGRPSQTDLLVLCASSNGFRVIGVEGKVDEPFGPVVAEWREESVGKERRLQDLLARLALLERDLPLLRYQLLHRTAAALIEAKRYGAEAAMMLVHSFSPTAACFDDFQTFSEAVGAPVARPGTVSHPIVRDGVRLSLGWAKDKVRTS